MDIKSFELHLGCPRTLVVIEQCFPPRGVEEWLEK